MFPQTRGGYRRGGVKIFVRFALSRTVYEIMWPFYFPIIYLCFIYVYIYIASCHIFSTNHKAGKCHKKLILKIIFFYFYRPVACKLMEPKFRPFCSIWNGFRDSAFECDIGNVKKIENRLKGGHLEYVIFRKNNSARLTIFSNGSHSSEFE